MLFAAQVVFAGMTRKPAIDELLNATPRLWQGRQCSRGQAALSTGHARLDARLPGQGWPLGAVTELMSGHPGLGEFSLLFPALAKLGEQGLWAVLVDPPWIPYPAALQAHGLRLDRLLLVRTHSAKESLWACEQALCCGRGGAVLAWPERIGFAHLRRLQLAAENHAKLAFLFRPESTLRDSSPAALRLQLQPGDHQGTRVSVLKCRGSRPPQPAWIPGPFSAYANQPYQTQGHALACPQTAAPGPGSAHPRPGRSQDSGRAQRYH
jgi:cell division inhibitor SulA/protein ImuA